MGLICKIFWNRNGDCLPLKLIWSDWCRWYILGSLNEESLTWKAANLSEPLFIPVQPTTVSEYPLPPIFQGLPFNLGALQQIEVQKSIRWLRHSFIKLLPIDCLALFDAGYALVNKKVHVLKELTDE